MSKITQLNLDGALLEVKDPRFENDKFFQYNLGTISETPDTSQNETLQKIYDAAASGGSVMAIYDGILLDVSEVSADKMVLSSSSGLTFLKINATVTAGAVTEAVRISTTPIIYGETDYEDGVTPLPTGTIYCYWGGSSTVQGLTFSSPNPFTLGTVSGLKGNQTKVEYSTDKSTWNDWDGGDITAVSNSNGDYIVIVRGEGGTRTTVSEPDSSTYAGINATQFKTTGTDITVSGNLTDFLDYTTTPTECGCMARLFRSCTGITDVSNLVFPETYTGYHTFNSMFNNCTSLTKTPVLPCKLLTKCCYYMMFQSCTSITKPIVWPEGMTMDGTSSDLATSNYASYMYAGCSGIKISKTPVDNWTPWTVIDIPNTLWPSGDGYCNNCINGMLDGCAGDVIDISNDDDSVNHLVVYIENK